MYLLGKIEYLDNLVKELKNGVYQNRCAAINMLEDIHNSENKEIIKSALVDLKKTEFSAAVLYDINRVLLNL